MTASHDEKKNNATSYAILVRLVHVLTLHATLQDEDKDEEEHGILGNGDWYVTWSSCKCENMRTA